jgi:outer membrane protein TolC
MNVRFSNIRTGCLWLCALLALDSRLAAQTPPAPTPAQDSSAPVKLTLQDALDRARKNSTVFQAAVTDAAISREDKNQARDALLPGVSYENSVIYSQGNGAGNPVRFIANNGVHEYISQANVHQVLDVASFAQYRAAAAAASAGKARAEVASRGLVVTVVQTYYSALAAQKKLESATKAAAEGAQFFQLTQSLEHGGEVAHADVIKAELQSNERQRQLQEARLAVLNSRLDLAVLLFPNFSDNFELTDDLHTAVPLPTLPEVQERAARDNPDLRVALSTVQESGHEVLASRAGYFPAVSLDYFYGIDAARFATRTDGISNLGSSVVATLNIPVWNWGATQTRVKQAELRRAQAQRELSLAQRKLLAEIQSLFHEAETASSELATLERSAQLGAESLRLAMLRYRNGETNILEVVDAQNTATASDAAFQDGAVRYRVALANLQTLTGELTTP